MSKALRYAIIILLVAGLAVCIYLAASDIIQKHKSQDTYTDAAETYTIDVPKTPGDIQEDIVEGTDAEGGESPVEVVSPSAGAAPITVDFDALLAAAPDVVGWIWCEGTDINYPIVQGDDDAFYLTHDYLGRRSSAGSIMLFSHSSPDFSDPNSLIYGHRMKNGTMFADVADWFTPGFYEKHPSFWIITPEGAWRADIFAAYETWEFSETYTQFLTRGTIFKEYLDAAAAKSIFTADVELDVDSNYIVLSTCKHATGSERLVIHAKLIPAGE